MARAKPEVYGQPNDYAWHEDEQRGNPAVADAIAHALVGDPDQDEQTRAERVEGVAARCRIDEAVEERGAHEVARAHDWRNHEREEQRAERQRDQTDLFASIPIRDRASEDFFDDCPLCASAKASGGHIVFDGTPDDPNFDNYEGEPDGEES